MTFANPLPGKKPCRKVERKGVGKDLMKVCSRPSKIWRRSSLPRAGLCGTWQNSSTSHRATCAGGPPTEYQGHSPMILKQNIAKMLEKAESSEWKRGFCNGYEIGRLELKIEL